MFGIRNIITLLVITITLISCSQTEVVVKNERARETYSRVYYKNKIIYNNPIKKDKLLLDDAALALSNDDELSEPIVPLEQYYSKKKEAVDETNIVSSKYNFFGFKSLYKSSNFEFLSKKVKSLSPEIRNSNSAEDFFGILSFVLAMFGALLFVVAFVEPLIFILSLLILAGGLVFGIMGIKGKYKILAVIAIVISISTIISALLLFLLILALANSFNG